jgi:predicted secreted hydrolase
MNQIDRHPSQIVLPLDGGPHIHSNIEWWYIFSFLQGDQGGKYALMASFFRMGEIDSLKGHYLIYSLLDLTTQQHRSYSFVDNKTLLNMAGFYLPYYLLHYPHDRHVRRIYTDLLRVRLPYPHDFMGHSAISSPPLRLQYGNHSLSFLSPANDAFYLQLVNQDFITGLQFIPQKPVALIEQNGKPNELFYYSFPRNRVEGQIILGGRRENVAGEGWFDHQWGYGSGLLIETGWNWFGIQLTDGRELLINQMRQIKTGQTFAAAAYQMDRNGKVLYTKKVMLEPKKEWKSVETGVMYPLEWRIDLPEWKLNLHASPIVSQQEMPVFGPLRAIWEGVCVFQGEEEQGQGQRQPISGKGFIELVGYANSSLVP